MTFSPGRKLAVLLGTVGALTLAAPPDAQALSSGDVVRVIVPYSAGGGFDAQARLAAPYVESALRAHGFDGVNVVVENVTGGGGAIATMQAFGARPDGTTLLLLDPESAIYLQTVGGAGFDVGQFSIIAQQSAEAMGVFVSANLGVDTFDELVERAQQRPLLMGTSGQGAVDHIAPMIMQRILEETGTSFPLQFVHLSGVADVMASMRRDEAEVMYATLSSTASALEQGVGDFLFTFEDHGPLADRWAHGRDVLAVPAEQAEQLTAASYFRRVYAGPPGMDPELLGRLREIFAEALNDPELAQKSAESNRPIMFLSGEDAEAAIAQEVELANRFADYLRTQID